MKQIKESKICSFTQYGSRLQLVCLVLGNVGEEVTYLYQIRLNRKIIVTHGSESIARQLFADYVKNLVLQLDIFTRN